MKREAWDVNADLIRTRWQRLFSVAVGDVETPQDDDDRDSQPRAADHSPIEMSLAAFVLNRNGSANDLANALRSDTPMSRRTREMLALYFEGRHPAASKRGAPKHEAASFVLDFAKAFFADWKAANMDSGLNDRGRSVAMKEKSIEIVVSLIEEFDLCDWGIGFGCRPSAEQVLERWGRPKNRH
jgi:hypothetical protein